MSCIISGNTTINRVIAAIRFGAQHGCPTPLTLLMPPRQVAGRLFAMNADAHAACYDGRHADVRCGAWSTDYEPQPVQASEMQLFKSLSFYLYQCSEGDIQERPLFKELNAIRLWLAQRVGYHFSGECFDCAKTKALYDAAEWG